MNALSHTVTMARMARSLLVPGLVWASLLAQAQPVSQRCFNACGSTGREGARNNAACGHCTDTPMPACDPPASGN